MKLDKFYINGQWVDPVKDETINIINPANESVIGQLNVGNEVMTGHASAPDLGGVRFI